MKKSLLILPILFGFYVMGFSDIIGTVLNQIKAECTGHADTLAFLVPIFTFLWFFVISIPTGILCGKIGRKNTVLIAFVITILAMLLPLAANDSTWYLYVIAFALIGIGNTIIQAALPALMSNVVEPDQLTSRISLGQFVKAVCAALTPVFVYLTATALGNWKLLFPLYGAITLVEAVWLALTAIPDERQSASEGKAAGTSFGSCLAMLGNPYVAAMTIGIFFSVGADVGFGIAIPEYLKNVFKVDVNIAGMGPTVYFVAKTVAALTGAFVFAKISAAKCFPWFMGLGLLVTALIPLAPSGFVFLAMVAVVALLTANSFGMCMGLAIEKVPEKANEISALMVMAIVGGGIIPSLFSFGQKLCGPSGIVIVIAVCIAYLFALGLFATKGAKKC